MFCLFCFVLLFIGRGGTRTVNFVLLLFFFCFLFFFRHVRCLILLSLLRQIVLPLSQTSPFLIQSLLCTDTEACPCAPASIPQSFNPSIPQSLSITQSLICLPHVKKSGTASGTTPTTPASLLTQHSTTPPPIPTSFCSYIQHSTWVLVTSTGNWLFLISSPGSLKMLLLLSAAISRIGSHMALLVFSNQCQVFYTLHLLCLAYLTCV